MANVDLSKYIGVVDENGQRMEPNDDWMTVKVGLTRKPPMTRTRRFEVRFAVAEIFDLPQPPEHAPREAHEAWAEESVAAMPIMSYDQKFIVNRDEMHRYREPFEAVLQQVVLALRRFEHKAGVDTRQYVATMDPARDAVAAVEREFAVYKKMNDMGFDPNGGWDDEQAGTSGKSGTSEGSGALLSGTGSGDSGGGEGNGGVRGGSDGSD